MLLNPTTHMPCPIPLDISKQPLAQHSDPVAKHRYPEIVSSSQLVIQSCVLPSAQGTECHSSSSSLAVVIRLSCCCSLPVAAAPRMGCSCYGSSLEYRVRGPGTPDPRDPGPGVPMIGPMNPRITIGFRGSPDPGSGAPRPRIRGPGPRPQKGTPFWTHFWAIFRAPPEAPLSRFWPGSPVLTVYFPI